MRKNMGHIISSSAFHWIQFSESLRIQSVVNLVNAYLHFKIQTSVLHMFI